MTLIQKTNKKFIDPVYFPEPSLNKAKILNFINKI